MSCDVKTLNFKTFYYKNEGCYQTENRQNEIYLGCSITKESWKLRGSVILHIEIYMTSRENREELVWRKTLYLGSLNNNDLPRHFIRI